MEKKNKKILLAFSISLTCVGIALIVYNLKLSDETEPSQSDETLLINVKAKLESALLDGSTLDELKRISFQEKAILDLINNFINDRKFSISLIHPQYELLQVNNIVKIKILYKNKYILASVRFKNVKKRQYEDDKLQIIFETEIKDLLGTDYKKNYRLVVFALHPDQQGIFFENWFKKFKNNNTEVKFNKIYAILSFKIFEILKNDVKEVETILKNLEVFDMKKLTENQVINQFCKYLLDIFIILTEKKNQ